jgi:hypothetical protein
MERISFIACQPPMKRRFILTILSLEVLAFSPLHGAESDRGVQRKLDPRLQAFFAAKERHARALTKGRKPETSPDVWAYFDAGIKGDWTEVKRLWKDLSKRSGQYTNGKLDESVRTLAWSPLLEAELAYEGFSAMDVKFIDAFARDVIDSIPREHLLWWNRLWARVDHRALQVARRRRPVLHDHPERAGGWLLSGLLARDLWEETRDADGRGFQESVRCVHRRSWGAIGERRTEVRRKRFKGRERQI